MYLYDRMFSNSLNNEKMNKTKIAYISGPITGLENGNFDAFMKAQKELEKEGYIVLNPHEIGKEVYEKWSKIEVRTKEQNEEMWQDYMKVCLKFLCGCDVVFLLGNWETSRGSTIELLVAKTLGIKIYYMKDFSEFDVTFQISKFDRVPV